MLAEKLGRTVAELEHEMSNSEFLHWAVYLGRKAQQAQLARAGGHR